MNRKRDPDEHLEALYDELIEGALSADEATLDAMLRAEGRDPTEVVAGLRVAFDTTSRNVRTRRLREAKAQHGRSVSRLREHQQALPASPEARRGLLDRTLRRSAEAREALTLQHRDFRQMTDEDVTGLLAQLAALGALPPDEDPEGSGGER